MDEIYVDLTDLPDDSAVLAQRLTAALRAATGLTCSIGITPNELLSKIASDLNKPNGITILGMAKVPTRIWPLPVKKVDGIGPKATAKLADLGITTVGELAAAAPEIQQERFGLAYAMWLQRVARGIDDTPFVPLPNRNRSVAKPRSSAISTLGAMVPSCWRSSPPCASRSAPTSDARATRRARSGSSCASPSSRR